MTHVRQLTCMALASLALGLVPWPLAGQDQIRVPVPLATGPVPVTSESYPLMADHRMQHPVDLPARGYIEDEFFVTGLANVYDWAEDGGISVRSENAQYTTRILVRRPADSARSSGSAWVELGNNARRYDWGFSWSLSYEHFIESGDTWVGITYASAAIDALGQFDPVRYRSLAFENPDPQPCGRGGNVSTSEDGLRWDMLSQVGALLKSESGPLGEFRIERVYAMSHGGELPTYVAAIHPRMRLEDGGPVYDGFILHRHNRLGPLHACGAAPPQSDPRHVIRDAGVPVIRIVAQTDVAATESLRREDSDAPNDGYRLYEVAGAPHADGAFYRHMPVPEDQEAVGTEPFLSYWPFADQCEPEIPMQDFPLMGYVANAAIRNLDAWVREGTPAPRAARMEIENGQVALDEFGNARGGVRSPYLDVPTATYVTTTGGPGGCRNLGYSEPFDWQRLESVYDSFDGYAERVGEAVDRRVRERWLTPDDGRRIRDRIVVPR